MNLHSWQLIRLSSRRIWRLFEVLDLRHVRTFPLRGLAYTFGELM